MKFENFIVRNRLLIIGISLLLLIGSIIPLTQVKINPDLETYMPAKMPAIVNNQKLEEIFGPSEPLLILVEAADVLNDSTLIRIRDISEEFLNYEEFNQVLSLFQIKNIHGDGGMMQVDPAIRRIPKTEGKREELRKELKNNEMACGLVVSDDFKYALIILNTVVENQDAEVMDIVNQVIKNHPGEERIIVGGQLVLRVDANDKIGRDLIILLPLSILIMLLFLWVSFREIKGVLLPFLVVVISIAFSMALIPLLGWELSIIGVLIPIMMVAIANNYGVHFIAKYQELNASDPSISMKDIVKETTSYLKKPIILTGLTTMVGIMGLLAHILLPAKQMGLVVSLGIGLALLLSLTLIPAMMLLLKKGKIHQDLNVSKANGYFFRLLNAIGLMNNCCPRIIIICFSLFVIVMGSGLFRLNVASDFNTVLPAGHPFNESISIADENFGGTKTIQVSFKGDMKDPDLLQRMDQYARNLEQIDGIGRVSSLASVVKLMSKSLYHPDSLGYNAIPDSRDAIAQFFELYNMSGDPDDFEQIVDFPYENSLMTIQFTGTSLDQINFIEEEVHNLVTSDPNFNGIAGFSLVEKELCENIAVGQAYSLLAAFLAIFILLMIIFRSLSAGIIGSLPLVFAVLSTFGLMGWFGIELNIVTALLSSISIGLGVDYTIHMFWRLQSEIRSGNTITKAISVSMVTIGRGISINATAVIIGFSVLFLSGFPLIRTFAFLIIISLFLCLISSLMLIPAIVNIWRPKFLTTGNKFKQI